MTESHTQLERLLNALIKGPVSTDQAKDELHIRRPGARIWELRRQGLKVSTVISQRIDQGQRKLVALYVLTQDAA